MARITNQRGKNQPAPSPMALTETTARSLREIQPPGVDQGTLVFGLTGETLANRCELWPGPPVWARTSPDTAAGSAWCAGWWRRGRPTRRCSLGSVEARRHRGPLHAGRGGRGGTEVAELTYAHLPATSTRLPMGRGGAGAFMKLRIMPYSE